MTVTDVRRDTRTLTLTFTAELQASVERVWNLWEDPRQLERWWGPPEYPATFVRHELSPGGRASYFMTGPEGDQPRGWWRILEVDAPHRLTFESGIADDAGNPDPAVPAMIVRATLTELSSALTRMEVETTYPSVAAMEQFLAMGMEEGMTGALSQLDDLLR